MQAPRAPYREMTDPENRYILNNTNPKLWACYQRSLARARFFGFPEKEERLKEALLMTLGLGGKGAELLRDSLQGAKAPQVALAGGNIVQQDRIAQPHL